MRSKIRDAHAGLLGTGGTHNGNLDGLLAAIVEHLLESESSKAEGKSLKEKLNL